MRETRLHTFLLFFLIAVSLWIFSANLWQNREFIIDDAFIEFRFARNLMHGYGLVWNPGETPRENYSNFLSILLFAPALYLKFDPIVVSKIIGIICALLTAWLVYLTCGSKGISRPAAVLASCLYLTVPALALHALSGLQTTLFCAVVFFFFFCTVKARTKNSASWYVLLFIAYLLTVLARPEGIFFASALLIFVCFYHNKNTSRPTPLFVIFCMACFIIGAFYALWKRIYFGSFIPSSFLVKIGNPWCLPGKAEAILFILHYPLFFICAFLGTMVSNRKSAIGAYAVFFALLIMTTYLFNCHLLGFESRFFMPTLPFILLLSTDAFELFLASISNRRLQFLFLLACLLLTNPANINPPGTVFVQIRKFLFRSREIPEKSWTHFDINIAVQLSKIKNAARLIVVAEDSGAIGYYSGCKVIDPIGLTNPDILTARTPNEFVDRILSYGADIILLRARHEEPSEETVPPQEDSCRACVCVWGALGRFGKHPILNDQRFKDKYTLLHSINDQLEWGRIYKWKFWVRKDSPYFSDIYPVLKDF